jgi:hypothetical protein
MAEYNQRVIAPRANDPRRWYEISRANMPPPTIPPFHVDRLAFLFEGPHKDLPSRLSINFVRFEGFLGLVRSAWDWNMQAQQLCAAQVTPPQNAMEIENLIGHVRLSALSNCTDSIIEYVHSLMPSVMSAALSLRAAMLSIYPHRTIIHFSTELAAVP